MTTTILILAANPIETDRLDLDSEQRTIERTRRESAKRDVFVVKSAPAAQWEDLQRELTAIQPKIVHYIGHGEGDEGLMLAREGGGVQAVTGDRLAEMFRLFPCVDCVVLNACHTEVQSIAIHEHVRCVVGMSQKMGDTSAREFAAAFYAAVFAGDSYARAFELGKLGIVSRFDRIKPMLLIREAVMVAIDLEPPGARMAIDSPFYVDRPTAEIDAEQEINRLGALLRIKGPTEFGKSSLMGRVVARAEKDGAKTVSINFREVEPEFLGSLNDFLEWFCNIVTEDLNFEGGLDPRRVKVLGSKKACGDYFERCLLPRISQSLVLELDEVDRLLDQHPKKPWVEDFFSMLRVWHDSKMKSYPEWKKLRLVLVHSKEIITLQQQQSPFNVGKEIELKEFTSSQAMQLAQRHGVDAKQTEQLLSLVGGHPQLVRMGLYAIAQGQSTLEQIQADGATEAGLYGQHLMQMRSHIEREQGLKDLVRRVLAHPKGVKVELGEKAMLRSLGVVVCQENGVRIACELYCRYFSELWL
jgi:hypothetical protein